MRLLFDELLPAKVARALRALGFRVSYVGADEDNQPARGSSDEEVLAHAQKTNQVVVTYNHDMLLLCAERNETVIWIDSRGRQLRFPAMARLAFDGIEEWERMIAAANEPICVHALRTKNETLTLDRAAHLVHQRIRKLKARERKRQRERDHGDQLLPPNTIWVPCSWRAAPTSRRARSVRIPSYASPTARSAFSPGANPVCGPVRSGALTWPSDEAATPGGAPGGGAGICRGERKDRGAVRRHPRDTVETRQRCAHGSGRAGRAADGQQAAH
ncbi:MAG: DUF5615 family PIN-like protein [Acidimicrobiia bacterium]|nr:DUF5615 family PIN-like protein [Acidimicrobiia bacterium]